MMARRYLRLKPLAVISPEANSGFQMFSRWNSSR